jgi:hypothetical protein
MKIKYLLCLVSLMLCQLLTISTASAGEEFYWKQSYGRGAGTIPDLTCPGDKEGVSGLCYEPCKDGTKSQGTHCEDKGKGNKKDYDRFGKGTAKKQVCSGNKKIENGLCYEDCRSNFAGNGPVCWSKTPPNYVACGAGFARSNASCGLITTDQTSSVLALAMTMTPATTSAAKAAIIAKLGSRFTKITPAIAKNGPEFLIASGKLIDAAADPTAKALSAIRRGGMTADDLKPVATAVIRKLFAERAAAKAGDEIVAEMMAALEINNMSENGVSAKPITLLRNFASLTSFVIAMASLTQPPNQVLDAASGTFGVIAAYAWTIYGEED